MTLTRWQRETIERLRQLCIEHAATGEPIEFRRAERMVLVNALIRSATS